MARKPLSKKTRFEVFKRDDFACQYCGRKTPEVVLEIDHVVPIVEGGSDEIENLLTACFDCNRGKSSIPLDSIAQVIDVAKRAQEISHREEQLRAYHAARNDQAQRIEREYNIVWNYWFECAGTNTLEPWYVPWESVFRKYVELIGVEEVKDAIRIAISKKGIRSDTRRYFTGILKRKHAELEGRATPCTICQKTIWLNPGEEVGGGWHHDACAANEKPDG
jgi:hypothetical protein